MPVMGDPSHADLIKSMTEKVPKILGLGTPNAPRAIVLVTAHWSERRPTISNGNKHKLYYDYGGFPPETYKLKYDAPGSPEVAKEVYEALEKAGLNPQLDGERGKLFLSSLRESALADLLTCKAGTTVSSSQCSSSTPKRTFPSSNSPSSPPTLPHST